MKNAYPNFQLSVPIHCEEWNTNDYKPLVVYLKEGFDDHKVDFVNAFDVDGNEHSLSLREEPTYPVVVVGISERVDRNGRLLSDVPPQFSYDEKNTENSGRIETPPLAVSTLNLQAGQANSLILSWPDLTDETSYELHRMRYNDWFFTQLVELPQNNNLYVDNNNLTPQTKVYYTVRGKNADGNGAWGPVMATTVSSRNDGESLRIKRMKFNESTLNNVESWVAGAPELRLRVAQGTSAGSANIIYTSSILEPSRRNDIKNAWWTFNFTILNGWYTSSVGTVLTFDWREEDPSGETTITISASYEDKADGGTIKAGGQVSTKVNNESDLVGQSNVYWWDLKSSTYDTGGFYWEFQ